MTVIGLLILALFVSCLVAMLVDIDSAIEEALLDEIWDSDDHAS